MTYLELLEYRINEHKKEMESAEEVLKEATTSVVNPKTKKMDKDKFTPETSIKIMEMRSKITYHKGAVDELATIKEHLIDSIEKMKKEQQDAKKDSE